MSQVFFTLDGPDKRWAEDVGTARRMESKRLGCKDRNFYSNPEDIALAWDIWSTGAELAIARYLNIEWEGPVNTFKKPDVGPFQVRCGMKLNYRLKYRDDDNPDETYISASLDVFPTYWLQGWLVGHQILQRGFKSNPGDKRPFWLVNVQNLRTMEELLASSVVKHWQARKPWGYKPALAAAA